MPAPRHASIVCRAELVYAGAGDLMSDVADLQAILEGRKAGEHLQRKLDKLHASLRSLDSRIVTARLIVSNARDLTATELT